MAFTPEQEAYLVRLADTGLAAQARDLKIAEVQAAQIAAERVHIVRFNTDIANGVDRNLAIRTLQTAIAADPEVFRLTAELELLP